MIRWGSSIRARDLKRLNKLTKMDGSVLGTTVDLLETMQQRIINNMKEISDNPERPLYEII